MMDNDLISQEELNKIAQAADTAEKMLSGYEKAPLKQRVKNAVYPLIGRSPLRHDMVFWPAGLLLLGLIECKRTQAAADYILKWKDKGAKLSKVDDALTGYAILQLIETGHTDLMPCADRIAEFIMHAPEDDAGSIIYGSGGRNKWIYADGTGQTSLFLIEYGIKTRNESCIKKGMLQISNFLEYGMDDASGLPYHGYDIESGISMGIIGWGRAVGWLLLGMQAAVKYAAGSNAYSSLVSRITGFLCTVLSFQREDGLFSWQLQALKGQADSSGSAMIIWAAKKIADIIKTAAVSVPCGEELLPAVEKAVQKADPALLGMISEGRVMGALAECIDFAQYRQAYGCYPWGQGSVLMALGKRYTGA